MHLSSPPLPCGSVVLHRVIETERCRCWVSDELCCVHESLRTNVMSALCRQPSNTANSLFLLWAALRLSLPVSSPVTSHLSLSPRGCVRSSLAPSYLLSPDHPLIRHLRESQCCSACSRWISANVVLPSPSCTRPLSFLPPSLPPSLAHWHVTSSGHSQRASAPRSNSDITPLYMSLQFLPK